MADGETPAGDAPPVAEPMQLIFRDSNNTEITFKLKPTTKFAKAFDAFAKKTERKTTELRFLYEGERLNAEQTIEEVGMEDGDTVDVHMEQLGGYNYSAAVNDEVDAQSSDPPVRESLRSDASAVPQDQIGKLEQSISEMRICITKLVAKLEMPTANDEQPQAAEDPIFCASLASDSPASTNALQRDIFADVASSTPTRVLFISNIDPEITDEMLEAWITQFGGHKTAFGVKDDAIDLFNELQGATLSGKLVTVHYATTREEAVTARIKALKIEEEVNALSSLAELANAEAQLPPPGHKITLKFELAWGDGQSTTYVMRCNQALRKAFEDFEHRTGHPWGYLTFMRAGQSPALKGCYSAINVSLHRL
nr:hypothetical protein B0A51_16046 [Rachicladosporium sp. CCFEE 5018]